VRWILLALTFVAAMSTAVAEGPTDVDIEAARAEFQAGNEDYIAGRYDEAIQHFLAAHELAPNPRLLEYIARAYVNMGDYQNAISYYERYGETDLEAFHEVQETISRLIRDARSLAVYEARLAVRSGVLAGGGQQPDVAHANIRRQELHSLARDVTVQILSEPRGADVYIDDISLGPVGTTPLTTPLFTGRHMIEVRRPHYAPARQVVTVVAPRAGEEIPVFRFNLERQDVPVQITVNPASARVVFVGEHGERVDIQGGAWEGELPAGPGTFLLQQAGQDRRVEHEIAYTEDGSPMAIELHLVEPLRTARIEVGTLIVSSTSSVGTVYVDGQSVGEAPGEFEVDVRAGDHHVELRHPGYTTWEQTVVVSDGTVTRIYTGTIERQRRRNR